LISHDSEGLQANGLPFLLQRATGSFGRLQAHIARANSQWRELDGADVLVVFQGPLNYLTPSL
jgi:transcriptional regulator